MSANGLRRKTQLSRNQSLISHLVSVLRRWRDGEELLCEISSFIFYLSLAFIEHVFASANTWFVQTEAIALSKFSRVEATVDPSILH